MNVLSIQSHVAYGHVGNRSAVFPLERLGIEVWPVNTVQFSFNTGKPGWCGTAFGADNIRGIVHSMNVRGVFAGCDAVLSGYMGDAGTGEAILEAVDVVRKAHPTALYCCDPVMGDFPGGLYVKPDLAIFMREQAVPRANIVIPNHFEAELLSGMKIDSLGSAIQAVAAIHEMGPEIVILTSFKPGDDSSIGFLVSDRGRRFIVSTPLIDFQVPPKGSGDLVSALFLGYYLKERDMETALAYSASALYGILEKTIGLGREELAIVEAQECIAHPTRRFAVERA
jgi:pyridoxine kinase